MKWLLIFLRKQWKNSKGTVISWNCWLWMKRSPCGRWLQPLAVALLTLPSLAVLDIWEPVVLFFFFLSPLFFLFFFLNFILFNFTILYWFCHISKWICHRYTYVPHPEPSSLLPPHTISLGCPSAPAPSIQWFLILTSIPIFTVWSWSSASPLQPYFPLRRLKGAKAVDF